MWKGLKEGFIFRGWDGSFLTGLTEEGARRAVALLSSESSVSMCGGTEKGV